MFGKLSTRIKTLTVALALTFSPLGLAQADTGELIVHVGTGDWAEALIKAYAEPFEEETGIKVITVGDWFSYAELKLWQESGRSEVDVSFVFFTDASLAYNEGWLEPIDYSLYGEDLLDGLIESAKQPWGVAAVYYAVALSYYSDMDKTPSTWADLWDLEGFPGKRTLRTGKYGVGGLYEIALLADGVSPDELYPLDLDRAGKSLDKMRDHVVKWWEDGSDLQQIFADRAVDMGPAFDGRMRNLVKNGLDITIDYNQALLFADYWVIPKGAPNVENAQKFVAFTARPDRQADSMTRIPYGPSNRDAFKHLEPEYARTLASHPDSIERMITVDGNWYAEKADDKTNLEITIDYWNKWRLQ